MIKKIAVEVKHLRRAFLLASITLTACFTAACDFKTTVANAPNATPPVDPGTAPVATALTPASFNEDTESALITLAYTDVDGDLALTCDVSHKTHVSVSTPCTCTAGVCTLKVTGDANYNGVAGFEYTVTANGQTSNSTTATFTIFPVSDNPIATAITPTAFNEDTQSALITLAYTDGDNDLATVCSITGLSHITVTQACACAAGVCSLKVTGTANYNGAAAFDFTVTAGGTVSNSAHATLTIAAVDDAPVAAAITPAAFDVNVQSPAMTLSYTDVDGDQATTCTISALSHVTVSQACACAAGVCTLKVTGATDYYGSAGFSYTVTAAGVASNLSTSSFTINPALTTSGMTQNHDASLANSGTTAAYTAGVTNAASHWFDTLSPTSAPRSLGNGCSGGTYSGIGTAASPYALSFVAADQGYSCTDTGPFGTATNFSVEVWFKSAVSMATAAGLLGDWANGEIGIFNSDGTGFKVVDMHNGSTAVAAVAYDTNWTQFVFTGDATNWKMYKNGALANQGSAHTLSYSPEDYLIGYAFDSFASVDYYTSGQYSIFRTYNRALTANEVQRNCDAYKARFQGATCVGP